MTERYLEGKLPSPAEIREALAGLTAAGKAYPALCGSALEGGVFDE